MILSCGEALIDLVVGPPAGGGFSCMGVPGGSPFNVAIGVARLGGKAGFLSKISTDFFGRVIDARAGDLGRKVFFFEKKNQKTFVF